ncbi:MAG: hypothetical protein KAI66_21430 [Lentisphaeria bacterium]|nr:hypothetical protein [Lentisphaeria bacterium]
MRKCAITVLLLPLAGMLGCRTCGPRNGQPDVRTGNPNWHEVGGIPGEHTEVGVVGLNWDDARQAMQRFHDEMPTESFVHHSPYSDGPLCSAVRSGSLEMTKLVLARSPAALNIVHRGQTTALDIARGNRQWCLYWWLRLHGGKAGRKVNNKVAAH